MMSGHSTTINGDRATMSGHRDNDEWTQYNHQLKQDFEEEEIEFLKDLKESETNVKSNQFHLLFLKFCLEKTQEI